MRRLTLHAAGVALVLALAHPAASVAQVAGPPAQQLGACINCTASQINGHWRCAMSIANTGWTTCNCNPLCDCSGDCVTPKDTTVTPIGPDIEGQGLGVLNRLPASGGILASAPSAALLASLDHGRSMGRVLPDVYVANNYGLVRRGDGAWRIFRLQADGTLVLRDCDGLLRGVVHRAGRDPGALPLAIASL
jgi:hypothetical protein